MNWRVLLAGVLALFLVLAIIAISLTTSKYALSKEQQITTSCVRLNGGETCHSTDAEPYRFYGTKTAYHVSLSNVSNDHFHFPGCVPKVFYLFSRHATRYPDKEDIIEMEDTLPLLRDKIVNASSHSKSNICSMDIEKLMSWTLSLVPDDDNRLSKTGEQEAFDLAKRYKSRFPDMVGGYFPLRNFTIEFTSKIRTETTARAFAKGLYGDNWQFRGKTNDEILTYHKTCKALRKKCNKREDEPEEVKKFEKGPFVKSLVRSLSRRLGFEISYDEVKIMHGMCSFSYALGLDDIWCSPFSNDELKVLEYVSDMDDYYEDGYSDKVNYQQACLVVDYLVKLFRSSVASNDKRVVLHFSHATAIKKLYARLGLFRDEVPLTAENMCSRGSRLWRSGRLSPFNSNIAMVLYDCAGEQKIAAFHNEFPVTLGGCSSVLCPVEDFFRTYEDISNNCNLKSMCCSCCAA